MPTSALALSIGHGLVNPLRRRLWLALAAWLVVSAAACAERPRVAITECVQGDEAPATFADPGPSVRASQAPIGAPTKAPGGTSVTVPLREARMVTFERGTAQCPDGTTQEFTILILDNGQQIRVAKSGRVDTSEAGFVTVYEVDRP